MTRKEYQERLQDIIREFVEEKKLIEDDLAVFHDLMFDKINHTFHKVMYRLNDLIKDVPCEEQPNG